MIERGEMGTDAVRDTKDICEFIWQMEKDTGLFDWNVQGVYVWKLLRTWLVRKVARELGLSGQAQKRSRTLRERVTSLGPYLFSSLRRHPYKPIGQRDYMFFGHSRVVSQNRLAEDTYLYKFIRECGRRNSLVIGRADIWDRMQDKVDWDATFHLLDLVKTATPYFYKPGLDERDANKLSSISDRIRDTVGVSIDLESIVQGSIASFKVEFQLYSRLFERHRPKYLMLVCSYGQEAAISAAQSKGIKVVEIQHGVIGRYHLGYNFPVGAKVPYFPDAFITFGEYWSDGIDIPLEGDKIIPYGFPILNDAIEEYRQVPKGRKLVFVSQGTVGEKLSQVACDVAAGSFYRVVYKLHSGEYERWEQDYPWLVEASRQGLIEVEHGADSSSIHKILSDAEYQCGVSSTALFEGMEIGCKTIIMNLSGAVYMEDLIRRGAVITADSASDVIDIVEKQRSPVRSVPAGYFFSDCELDWMSHLERVFGSSE